ncbi:MAG TPA: EAL domain-containing protein [Actinomycetes bacterium]|nr:EAL domain-containing protein [Actinomycetes bacterium]
MSWARKNSWWVFLLACSLLIAVYYSVPFVDGLPRSDAVAQSLVWAAVVCLTVTVMLVAIVALRLPVRRVWILFTLGVAFTGAADVLWEFPELIGINGEIPYPSLLDALYLASYVFLFAGILALVRSRSPHQDRAALIDALIVSTAAALTSWIFIIAPSLDQSADGTLSTAIVTAAYPLMDVFLLGAATRLWFAFDSGRNTSMRFIVLTLVAVLMSDTAFTYFALNDSWSDGTFWDLGWFVFYLGMGAAALHPSVVAPIVATPPERAVSRWRFVLLLALMTVLPLTLLVGQLAEGSQVDGLVIILGTLFMFALVLVRLNDLVQQLRETLRRERVIRDANGALAAATDTDTIRSTVVTAAADLHQGARSYVVDLRRGGNSAVVTQTVPPGRRFGLSEQSSRQLVENTDKLITVYGPSPLHRDLELHENAAVTARSLTDSTGKTDGYLILAGNPELPRETPQVLAALAEAASLAKARIGLGRVLAERASELRLRRMLQHSTDIIAVLDLDLSIRYLSPGAERMLGVAPHHVFGTSWLDAVFPADRGKASELIEASTAERPAQAEFRLLAGDGSHRYVDVVATRVIEHDEPGFVLTCHDVTERRALEKQLSYQAFHDSLTGLANRALFRDRLEHAIARTSRTSTRFAVLFIDLDDFKDINDSLGHAAGDSLLRQMTHRLADEVREEDTVARLGGDEFAILLESIDDDDEVEAVASRIVQSAREPFEIGKSVITTGLSVGIAVADGTAASAEAVMRNADLALYEAKNLGKNRHALFEPAMHEQAVDRLQLSADLRGAIDEGQLVLHYQPIIELTTDRIVGVEALVRWQHPERGLLGPAQFIGLAEESGLIVPLGHYVLRHALRTAAQWESDIPECTQLTVTVNLSARQVQEDTLVDEVGAALADSSIDASRLVLEITESMLLPGEGVTMERLRALADLGVRLFIDDFGTGYSSLSYLQQLPVHGIKLAREFVTTLTPGGDTESDGSNLVSTIRSIAETLGLSSIIAEGVETPEQRRALIELGYTHGQGYLMARPMPASALAELLREQSLTRLADART